MKAVFLIATDLIKEAFLRRYIVGIMFLTLFLVFLILIGLRVDMVDGAIAATEFFGEKLREGTVLLPEKAFDTLFGFVSGFTFYTSIILGIVLTPDLILKHLEDEQVLFDLSLPIDRTQLLWGLFAGGVLFYLIIVGIVLSMFSAVFYLKLGMNTLFLVKPILWGTFAFVPLLAVMLAWGVSNRSISLAIGIGIICFMLFSLTSYKVSVIEYFSGSTREFVTHLMSPLPRIGEYAKLAVVDAVAKPVEWGQMLRITIANLMFSISVMFIGLIRFHRREI